MTVYIAILMKVSEISKMCRCPFKGTPPQVIYHHKEGFTQLPCLTGGLDYEI